MGLIVCANAAGLQMARAVRYRRELAVGPRLAGAAGVCSGSFRTESAMLSTAGGVVDVLVATGGVRGLVALQPRPAVWGVTVDPAVLGRSPPVCR